MSLLSIRNLHATIGEREILKGINLEVNRGEVHAIMGPNGNGKSTLAGVVAGNPPRLPLRPSSSPSAFLRPPYGVPSAFLQ